jgi:ATP phosphoribosyltransferase
VDEIFETNTVLIANNQSWEEPAKRAKIESIAMLLQAALEAGSKVGLKLNVERIALDKVLEALPALRNPTLSPLTDEAWVAVETVIEKQVARELIPALKRIGAEGIVEYPLNKLIP